MNKKYTDIMYRIMLYILLVIFGYISYCTVFNIYRPAIEMKPIVIMIGVIVLILLMIKLYSKFKPLSKRQTCIIASILLAIFFIGMCVIGNLVTSIPSFDLSSIIREENIMLKNGGKFVSEAYFARYTNQSPVAILIYFFYKLGATLGISACNLKRFMIIINSLFVTITALFTFLSVKKIYTDKAGLLALLFFVINPIFYVYSSYFYTDTLCMPFASIAIYLFIIATKTEATMFKQVLIFMLAGAVLGLGFEIRVVLGILLIGMALAMIINRPLTRKKFLSISLLIIGFVIGIVIYFFVSQPFGILKNKNLEYPIVHWVMFALNEKSDGKFNADDFSYTHKYSSIDEKKEADLKRIKKRLDDMGISGWISLAKKKIAVNWSNGDYDYISKMENVEEVNKLYEYVAGNKKIFLLYLLQIFKATLMIAFTCSILEQLRKRENTCDTIIYISIFGAVLFYFIWEVSSRYSLCFIPWMTIVFVPGLEKIQEWMHTNRVERQLENGKIKCIDTKKQFSSLLIMTFILTATLGLINYPKYTIKKQQYTDSVVVQAKNNEKGIPEIADHIIEQTFVADKDFNIIKIKFAKGHSQSLTNYFFILLNSDGETIVQERFDNQSITDQQYKVFNVKHRKKGSYTIKISAEAKTEKNTIGVLTYNGYGNYDIYPKGTLRVDGQEIEQDITFLVQNQKSRPLVSKKTYLFIIFVVLLLEMYSFYPYIKRKEESYELENDKV